MKLLPSVVLVLTLLTVEQINAAKIPVFGVTVSYSGAFNAGFDPGSGFLIVVISEGGGSLKIKADSTAPFYWGEGCPVLISAAGFSLKSISVKGVKKLDFRMHVIGECYAVDKFKGVYTDIGGLLPDPEVAFYQNALAPYPKSLSLKAGIAWGTFGGVFFGAEPETEPEGEFPVKHPKIKALLQAARENGGVRVVK